MAANPFIDANGNVVPIPRGGGRDIISQLLGQQQASVNELNATADKVEAQPNQLDISPLLALADAWSSSGGGYSKGYTKPQTPQEKQLTAAKLRELANGGQQKVTDSVLKDIIAGDKNDTMFSRFLASQGDKTDKKDWMKELAINKMTQEAKKDLDIYRSARGAVGDIAKTGVRASRAQTLIEAFKDKKTYPNGMPPAQLAELAQALASLVGNSNVVNQEQINNILPKGINKDAATLQSYLMSEPTGANMQPFVEMLGGTIDREAKTAAKQARALRLRYLPAHRTLYDSAPDRLKALAGQSGISPQELDDVFSADPAEAAKAFEEMPVFTDAEATGKKPTWSKAQVEAAAAQLRITPQEALKRLQGQGHGVE